ncbi:hypothetical protein C2845_PM01G37830 [Panicum miliaceum]|uniref:non-specific serine/threonine protein kinase n=1 Tax=Panicum miliaceum TaxID=4540 RepID=A0A3L6TJB1_PANMI|nr:hypothetical protein C2845_PM01G37830 [Panicum miliaceum]
MAILGDAATLATVLYCYLRRGRKMKITATTAGGIAMQDLLDPEEQKVIDSLAIDLQTLRTATEDNMLGQGGFSPVYKETLPDSQIVAVKRLSENSQQGIGELKNELVLLAKLRHRNLVRVIGVCLEEREKLIVYKFLPKRSLDNFIYGLQYLHEDSPERIVHRDLKPQNVLLDSEFKPKISDFGLAKIFVSNQSQDMTQTRAGTRGYMAPEYVLNGLYSTTDVYSFGVLIMEIITGKPNNGGALLPLVWEHWTNGTILDLVDSSLVADKIVRCIHIGLLCVQDKAAQRPTMSTVLIMLNSSSGALIDPLKPLAAALVSEEASSSVPARRSLPVIMELEESTDT